MLRRTRMVRRETRKNKVAERSDYGMAQVHESTGMESAEGGRMLVAIWIALANGLHIPPIIWVLFGLELAGRLLNMWLKD